MMEGLNTGKESRRWRTVSQKNIAIHILPFSLLVKMNREFFFFIITF